MEYVLAWLFGNFLFFFGVYLLSLIGLRVIVRGKTVKTEEYKGQSVTWIKLNMIKMSRGMAIWCGIITITLTVLLL